MKSVRPTSIESLPPVVENVDRSKAAGITKVMSPHRVRHSAITAFLDASGGDVRSAQGLSRHKNLNTLTRYDDNRHQYQAKASSMLEDLV